MHRPHIHLEMLRAADAHDFRFDTTVHDGTSQHPKWLERAEI